MPGKSRRKGKSPFQSKKKREKQRSATGVVQQQAVAQTTKPFVTSTISAPSKSRPTPSAKLPVARYPYVAAELRRIGILAGIMLAILIVLALVLPYLS